MNQPTAPPTVVTMRDAIGKTAAYGVPPRYELTIIVRILDARTHYGRIEYLITPQAGAGHMWVHSANVRID